MVSTEACTEVSIEICTEVCTEVSTEACTEVPEVRELGMLTHDVRVTGGLL